MNCPSCNTENPDDATFCSQCGATLTISGEQLGEAETTAQGLSRRPSSEESPVSFQTMEFAGFFLRVGAFAVDLGVMVLALIILAPFLDVLAMFVWPGYFIYMTKRSGQTIGKKVLGLKVVNSSGDVPRTGKVVNRELFRFGLVIASLSVTQLPIVVLWAVLGALVSSHLAAAFNPLRRGWHDRLAGTYVIRVSRATYIPPPR